MTTVQVVFKKNVLFRKLELEERLRREAEEFEKRRKEEEEASRLLLVCFRSILFFFYVHFRCSTFFLHVQDSSFYSFEHIKVA